MKIPFTFALCISAIITFAQNGVTFKIEDLTPPKGPLSSISYSDYEVIKDKKLIACSEMPQNMAIGEYGFHPFYEAVSRSYFDHRPLVLSPDMIWLLIEQGFASHVNSNHNELRHMFVDFEGKKNLQINVTGDPALSVVDNMLIQNWDSIIQRFPPMIAEYTGDELMNTLTADFSTTTSTERIASEIAIMKAMENYFEYEVFIAACGIPEITLLGTTDDWLKVIEKTKKLSKYNLEWWTNRLVPILEQFVRASQNDIDKKFWKNIYKYHSGTGCKRTLFPKPAYADGWFVNFFPYDKDGNKISETIKDESVLPNEMVTVEIKLKAMYEDTIVEKNLLLSAGFIGAVQDSFNYALTPQIGWFLEDSDNIIAKINDWKFGMIDDNIISENNDNIIVEIDDSENINDWGRITIDSIPEDFRLYKSIESLKVKFTKNVFFPEWMKDIDIKHLDIKGAITDEETEKIKSFYPDINIYINKDF